MRIIWITALVLALAIALVVSAGWAQGFGSPAPERYFRVEAEGGQGQSGRPAVRGYIYNDNPQAAGRVQVAVESLDAAGQVVNRSVLPLDGVVPAFNRLYFDIRVPTTGASYRVSVYYYEWLKGGGGSSGLLPGDLRSHCAAATNVRTPFQLWLHTPAAGARWLSVTRAILTRSA